MPIEIKLTRVKTEEPFTRPSLGPDETLVIYCSNRVVVRPHCFATIRTNLGIKTGSFVSFLQLGLPDTFMKKGLIVNTRSLPYYEQAEGITVQVFNPTNKAVTVAIGDEIACLLTVGVVEFQII